MAALDDKLGPDDLDGIIAEIDTDGSGTVDFDGECGSINPPDVPQNQKMTGVFYPSKTNLYDH